MLGLLQRQLQPPLLSSLGIAATPTGPFIPTPDGIYPVIIFSRRLPLQGRVVAVKTAT